MGPRFGIAVDYLIPAALLAGAAAGIHALLARGYDGGIVTSVVVAGAMAIVAGLEFTRPQRPDFVRFDRSFWNELGHFLVGSELGTVLGLGVGVGLLGWLANATGASGWPTAWPMPAQVVLAMAIADGVSYWQHRLVHRVPWLWPFHALHHSSERMSFFKSGRFHAVDLGLAIVFAYGPLVLLGAPPAIHVWVASLTAVLGLIQHTNARMRVPRWLEGVVCTPADHWLHHSQDLREGNSNFATTFMIFDRLLGTYGRPTAGGPPKIGIADDPTPTSFVSQVLGPFGWRRGSR